MKKRDKKECQICNKMIDISSYIKHINGKNCKPNKSSVAIKDE